jgi:hypothetical protein
MKEVVESDEWSPFSTCSLVRANPDPIDLPGDPVGARGWAESANTNNCVKISAPNFAHAIVAAETTTVVRITVVSPLIHEYTHDGTSRQCTSERLRSLAGPAARNVVSRKTVMPARSSATRGSLRVSLRRPTSMAVHDTFA